MNHFVPTRFDEQVYRLALGLEIVDAERQERVGRPISVAFDGVPKPIPPTRQPYMFGGLLIEDVLPRVPRHDSCVHALIYRKGLYRPPAPNVGAVVKLRFLSGDRRYVPRRLSFPLLDPAPIEAADEANPAAGDPALLGTGRIRGVYLFPGAAYDVSNSVTGLRGRVRSSADGSPVRWVRVEAYVANRDGGRGALVGRAQGDDRGEFLLLIWPEASGIGPLRTDFKVSIVVDVIAPAAPPPVSPDDPLADLPLEVVTGSARTDPVTRGEQLPPGYTVKQSQTIDFALGRFMTSEVPPFLF